MQELERQFKANGGTFEEYRVGELFEISTPKKKFNANAIEFGTKYRYVVRTSQNNGVRGFLDEDEKYLNPANTISFGQDTATIFYQDQPYFTGDKIKIMKFLPKELNSTIACYLLSVMNKAFSTFQWGQSSFNEKVLSDVIVFLPTLNGEIAFPYMGSVICELQNESIIKLNAYLKSSGLENTELAKEEKDAVFKLRNGDVEWKEFKVGELFEHLRAPYLGENPRQENISRIKTDEFNTPVICAKRGDNGIMYWGREKDFTTYGNVLSVIYNGAIAAGLVYAQNEPVGIFTDSYLIRYKGESVTFRQNLFLKTTLQKVIFEKYSRELKAVWKRISENEILLPVTAEGKIDWDFMQNLITAESRLAIRGVVEWKASIESEMKSHLLLN